MHREATVALISSREKQEVSDGITSAIQSLCR
jgi:hypothetical protein